MDLGIEGLTALVCASTQGLGKACATALAAEGVDVTILSRTPESVQRAAADIERLTGRPVRTAVCDITTPEGRALALATCPQPDILVTNAGGPPPGNFRDWTRDHWIAALDANMLTPIELIKATIDGMIECRFGRIVNITSGAVKHPIDILGLSNGARSGLTGFIAGLSREVARHGVTINNLLPGAFETNRLMGNLAAMAQKQGTTQEVLADQRRAHIPARRFGQPDEFGATCAFLCSRQAGYITAQNVLVDGGAYPGTF